MPITREALARLERIFDALEEAHEAELIQETLEMTDAEIEADLRAWGIDPDKLVEDARRQLGFEAGNVESVTQQARDGASDISPTSHRESKRLQNSNTSRDRRCASSKSPCKD